MYSQALPPAYGALIFQLSPNFLLVKEAPCNLPLQFRHNDGARQDQRHWHNLLQFF